MEVQTPFLSLREVARMRDQLCFFLLLSLLGISKGTGEDTGFSWQEVRGEPEIRGTSGYKVVPPSPDLKKSGPDGWVLSSTFESSGPGIILQLKMKNSHLENASHNSLQLLEKVGLRRGEGKQGCVLIAGDNVGAFLHCPLNSLP